ncbi:uncharacterized protein LOC123301265 [Chrysoperla carnea]|uniref:uncharacterized protein LOC123301265 n=1 Tax=Chrysoperla carnea TaxID=189513 RepID=UPI001D07010C|nr:uncharacterized protein LOC123301265 [Chrysoperla carnea]
MENMNTTLAHSGPSADVEKLVDGQIPKRMKRKRRKSTICSICPTTDFEESHSYKQSKQDFEKNNVQKSNETQVGEFEKTDQNVSGSEINDPSVEKLETNSLSDVISTGCVDEESITSSPEVTSSCVTPPIINNEELSNFLTDNTISADEENITENNVMVKISEYCRNLNLKNNPSNELEIPIIDLTYNEFIKKEDSECEIVEIVDQPTFLSEQQKDIIKKIKTCMLFICGYARTFKKTKLDQVEQAREEIYIIDIIANRARTIEPILSTHLHYFNDNMFKALRDAINESTADKNFTIEDVKHAFYSLIIPSQLLRKEFLEIEFLNE